jgi:multicomponent Na+:H+ antiporter subunit G
MPSLLELLVAALLLAGTFLVLLSGIGLVRFPDVYTRMHAAGKAGTLGVVLLIMATTISVAGTPNDISLRGILAMFFQFLTTPAATHLLAQASYLCEYPLSERTVVDELRGFLPSQPDEVFNRE